MYLILDILAALVFKYKYLSFQHSMCNIYVHIQYKYSYLRALQETAMSEISSRALALLPE